METIGRAIDLGGLKFGAVVGVIGEKVDIFLLIVTFTAVTVMIYSDANEMKKKGLLREYKAVRFLGLGLFGAVSLLYMVSKLFTSF